MSAGASPRAQGGCAEVGGGASLDGGCLPSTLPPGSSAEVGGGASFSGGLQGLALPLPPPGATMLAVQEQDILFPDPEQLMSPAQTPAWRMSLQSF